jgi:hypothetical protein
MEEAGLGPGSGQPIRTRRKLSRLTKWLLWIGAAVLLVLMAVGVTIAILLHRAEPMLRASLIDTLQKRFHSRVELDSLHVSVMDGFQAEGNGLRIWLPREAVENLSEDAVAEQGKPDKLDKQDKPSAAGRRVGSNAAKPAGASVEPAAIPNWKTEPWIIVNKIHFHVAGRILPGKPIVISVIYVEGVRVLLPPKADRPHLSLSGGGSAQPGTSSPEQSAVTQPQQASPADSGSRSSLFKLPQIEVKRIECQDALLVIERRQEPGKAAKIPLDFEFKKATVVPYGNGTMSFAVDMVNAKPIGDIHSTGHAGPWVPRDPGALPIDGDYKFDHADLSTIKGIAGILSSTGYYSGTLRQIEAEGDTQTPDFRLERVSSASGESLTTHFHAIVDGTNGDTWLQPVDAMLGHTHIVAKGKVVRAEDSNGQKHGHNIVLEVAIDRGRIEDILQISATQEAPFMTGSLVMNTHFFLPAGPESVWEKLQLNGQFHLSQARFNSDKMQGRIEQLSMRGQGKPGEVKTTDPTTILSEMQGHFKLGDGSLQLPDLDYHVPGADIVVHGSYGLQAGTLDFEGDAKLEATISQIVGGWKGLLLKPADHYLRKNGAGTDLPIHISGTRKSPEFGVEFSRMGKKDKPEQVEDPD